MRTKSLTKKIIFLLIAIALLTAACAPRPPRLTRYDAQFLQLFDTITSVVGYSKDKETFTAYAQELHDELKRYHQLYDIYNNYEGINNLKTVNDNAGIRPIVVDQEIIDLIEYARTMDQKTDGKVNIAMGSVLSIWHDYRTEGIDDPEEAQLPPMEALNAASAHTDIQSVIIDRAASTVYLPDPDMSLDVGAIAKGYATEQVCRTLEADGFTQALVSVGGNIRAIGTKENEEKWSVGIQNPDTASDTKYLHNIKITDMSLVTSGSYQRYYTVDGKPYHHIINPETLMPWNEYASVSILCKDSGMADALSTAVFNMNLEEGKALIEETKGTEALWIYPDGAEVYSSGFQAYLSE